MTSVRLDEAARTSELAPCPGACGCASATAGGVRAKVTRCKDQLYRQVEEHPGRTVAAAVGAGYVLGGGLFSRLTGRILGTGLRLAFRMAVVPLVAETIVALTESALFRNRRPHAHVRR